MITRLRVEDSVAPDTLVKPRAQDKISSAELRKKGIDPARYNEWISRFQLSDRKLAKRLVQKVQYISEKEVEKKMNSRWKEILKLADGKNIYWSSVARSYRPSGGGIEGGKVWEPSGYQVTRWFVDYLKSKGFKEYNPKNDPLYSEFKKENYLLKQVKGKGPFVLSKDEPFNRGPGYRVNASLFYEETRFDSQYWHTKGFPQVLFLLEKDGQRIALTSEFRAINALAVHDFLLEGPDLNTEAEVGVVALGEDWTLGATYKSNAAEHLAKAYQKAQFLFRENTKLVLSYGFATQKATSNLKKIIDEVPGKIDGWFRKNFPDKDRIHILHENDRALPVVSNFFRPSEIQRLSKMLSDQYNDRDDKFFLDKLARSVLAHTGLSVPDNMPELLFVGRSYESGYPLLIHPKKKK